MHTPFILSDLSALLTILLYHTLHKIANNVKKWKRGPSPFPLGAISQNRTGDLQVTNLLLYQLSYYGKLLFYYTFKKI